MYRRALAILLALTMILPPFFASGQAQENELVLRVAMQDEPDYCLGCLVLGRSPVDL
jgi:hypothetical protein